MILSRLVNPRASRMADIVASVPLLHIRTFWMDGKNFTISSAIDTSQGFGVPKDVPFSSAAAMAALIRGWLWPWIAGPQVQTKSINSRPSAVVSVAPLADLVKNGAPPTEPNAPTREFTPPGMNRWSRATRTEE